MSRSSVVVRSEPSPDDRVISFGSMESGGVFQFEAGGVKFLGKPAWGAFQQAMTAASYLAEHSPFWKADLLEYAHKRKDWDGLIDAVIDAGAYTKRAVDQMRYVSRNVSRSDRVAGMSFAHHESVASLPSADKRKYLQQAKDEHLTVPELRQIIRRDRKVRTVLKGQAPDLARALDQVAQTAHTAAEYCREIARSDAAGAEKMIGKARAALDLCAEQVKALRALEGL